MTIAVKPLDAKALRILAKSLHKELRANGYAPNHILALSTELLELVTQDIKSSSETIEAVDTKADPGWRAAI
jgi:hypothetical protein